MTWREDDHRDTSEDRTTLERLMAALEREDHAEVERLRAELLNRDDASLFALEHDAEHAARARRDGDLFIDRVRNIFQAIVLLRWLRSRRR